MIWKSTIAFAVLAGSFTSVVAQVSQTAAQTPVQTRPATPPRTTVTTPSENKTVAPQVVTVVHRLNGLKMFRLLLRSQQEVQAIANLDEAFKLVDDVHTNVIAGLALEDGRTIAARLPEADIEFPSIASFSDQATPFATTGVTSHFEYSGGLFESPDLTVIDSTGKKMSAEFVGVDGATGLSILKIAGNTYVPSTVTTEPVKVGEDVRLFGPEPDTRPRRPPATNLYVRMGEATGTISNVTQASSGEVARFKVRSPRLLSLVNVGGIAINSTGEAVGIVDSVEGMEASVLPAAMIRRAVRRVLSFKTSVPKPWLGVRGQPVAALNGQEMQKLGWELLRANEMAQEHRGILLTWIAPDSPAALAALRAGDVILKVNDEDVQNATDFTWYLDQAGPASSVEFTVARPGRKAEEAVRVKLSRSPANRSLLALTPSPKERWLISQGVETIALRPAVATRLGATSGLLIVFVQPSTPAFEAGLQAGDVIQTINGRPALLTPINFMLTPNAKASTFEIVRKKQKMVVAVPTKKQ